jgi:uncharacterized protein DUF3300/endosialidase-like protein
MPVREFARFCCSLMCIVVFVASAQAQQSNSTSFSKAELEQLVAPIALHPDPLLSQILMASTYPTEVVQAERWAVEHKNLDGDQLQTEVEKQGWDSSVKSLVATPSVLTMMSKKLDWTQKLGDAVLAQQADVMEAVQSLRAKAYAAEKLKTTEQQKVSVKHEGGRQAVAIAPADPATIYVPQYDPRVVYGEWPYSDYPPYYWEDSYGGVIGTGIVFGGGYALWRWISGGRYWGGDINWNGGDINFNRGARVEHWRHDPRHRGNVPYRDAHVAQRFGDANRAAARDTLRGNADAGRGNLATKAGAAAAGAAAAGAVAKAKSGAAAKSRPSPAKQAAKAKSAKTKSAANRTKSARSANHAGRSKSASRTRHASGRGAATHRAHARTRSPVRHAQRHAFRPSMGGRGGGFRASGFRGGGGGFRGGGGRGGGRRSDVALKHDIILLGHLDNGLGFYRFAYNGSKRAYVGVLAQEVQRIRPDAVVQGSDGYLSVHYHQLGLKFQTYRSWMQLGAHIPGR